MRAACPGKCMLLNSSFFFEAQWLCCYMYLDNLFSQSWCKIFCRVFSFNSSVGGMVFENQFIQLSSLMPSNVLYGLGEHVAPLQLDVKWTRSTLFSRDPGGTPKVHVHLNELHLWCKYYWIHKYCPIIILTMNVCSNVSSRSLQLTHVGWVAF